ncbi:MAG: DUF5320 domain-containing protein [Syntrophobacteraceae bacterium]|nr:DUF5320 domain-containing protein [Syntrophobacteraceae bacterium]
MPGRDGSGPRGLGPMTGRGMGFCAVPGSTRHFGPGGAWGGGGYGLGGRGCRSMRRATGAPGWGRGWWGAAAGPPWTVEDELNDLKSCADGLEAELRAVRERMEAVRRSQDARGEEP